MVMYGWKRYLSIEEDFIAAQKYVKFDNANENVYSEFFTKAIILLGAEVEAAMKKLCNEINISNDVAIKETGNIGERKGIILGFYPGIVNLKAQIRETNIVCAPFKNWDQTDLYWWNVYTEVKHNDVDDRATMKNAFNILAAHYILLFSIHTTDYMRTYKNDSYALNSSAQIGTSFDEAKLLISDDINALVNATRGDGFYMGYYPKVLENKLKNITDGRQSC